MNEMTLLVNAARTDPILRDAALAVEKRLLEAQRSYETAERAAVMWMERAEAAEAAVERLAQAVEEERRWATGTAEHNDARTHLYSLAHAVLAGGKDTPA